MSHTDTQPTLICATGHAAVTKHQFTFDALNPSQLQANEMHTTYSSIANQYNQPMYPGSQIVLPDYATAAFSIDKLSDQTTYLS